MSVFALILAHSKLFHYGFAALGTVAIVLINLVKYSRPKKAFLCLIAGSLAIVADVLFFRLCEFLGTSVHFWTLKSKYSFLDRFDFFTNFARDNLFSTALPLVFALASLSYLIWNSVRYKTNSKIALSVTALTLGLLSIFVTFFVAVFPIALCALFYHHHAKVRIKKIAGIEVFENNETLGLHRIEQGLKPEACDGIELYPGLKLTRSQECTHMLLIGAQGSGKTNLLVGMLEDIIRRGDKIVIYDYKQDLTGAFCGDSRVGLLTPFDKRSFVWDIAKDLKTELDAEEFANVLCPDDPSNSKPFFAIAARDLIVGCIKKLQVESEGSWTFSDLYSLVSLQENIEAACKKHRIEALQTIGTDENDQGLGVIGEIRNRTRPLAYLAKAWPTRENALSISDWLAHHSQCNALIIQANPRFKELDKFFTIQIYSYLFREVLAYPDSQTRRIWAVIDEFPTLPLMPGFADTLRAGRSKGLCVVAIVQDFGKLKQVYESDGGMEALSNGFGVKIVGRLNCTEAAEYASKLCGDAEFEKTVITRSKSGAKTTRSEHVTSERKRAVPADKFLSIKQANLKIKATLYYICSGLPIVRLQHKIRKIAKRSETNVKPEWMSKTPKQEFDMKKIPDVGLGDFHIKVPSPC